MEIDQRNNPEKEREMDPAKGGLGVPAAQHDQVHCRVIVSIRLPD